MQIVVLAGGVGGSRFVRGVREAYPDAEIAVVVNTADDITLHGLRICPDLDTMMYALGGGADLVRGWGRTDESWQVLDELSAYGVEPLWFSLGDRDIATHLIRTQLLGAGHPLSDVTRALCARWLPGSSIRLLPMSDDRVETHVVIVDPTAPGGRRAVHFQEYWVRRHAEPEALAVVQLGIEESRPGPGVLEAIAAADLLLVAPSNPVVSVGPVLAVPGMRAALAAAAAPVIGFAGILGGAPVLGMAHRLLPAIGVEVDAGAVGRHYGARSAGGLLDLWVMDRADSAAVAAVEAAGLPASSDHLIMHTPADTAGFVVRAVRLVQGHAQPEGPAAQ